MEDYACSYEVYFGINETLHHFEHYFLWPIMKNRVNATIWCCTPCSNSNLANYKMELPKNCLFIETHSYASLLILSVAFLWKLYVIIPSISMFSIFLISLFPFLALRNSPCRELLIYFVTMLWQVLASLSVLCLTQTIGSSVISQKLYGIYWVSK